MSGDERGMDNVQACEVEAGDSANSTANASHFAPRFNWWESKDAAHNNQVCKRFRKSRQPLEANLKYLKITEWLQPRNTYPNKSSFTSTPSKKRNRTLSPVFSKNRFEALSEDGATGSPLIDSAAAVDINQTLGILLDLDTECQDMSPIRKKCRPAETKELRQGDSFSELNQTFFSQGVSCLELNNGNILDHSHNTTLLNQHNISHCSRTLNTTLDFKNEL